MNEKIERLKAELVVFKGLMSDVSGVAVTLGIMTSLYPSCQALHHSEARARLIVTVVAGWFVLMRDASGTRSLPTLPKWLPFV